MQRLAGVVASVVLLTASSILCLTFAAIFAATVLFLPIPADTTQAPKAFLFVPVGLFAGFALWAMVTAVGLWRMRSWARISVLVFAALMVFFSAASLLFVFVMSAFLPPDVQVDMDSFNRIRMIMALFYGTPLVLGIWWLVYFSRTRVREALTGGQAVEDPRKIPLSIAVIAWHMLVFAVLMVPMLWWQWPCMLLGMVFTGWSGTFVSVLWITLLGYGGYGLLKYKPGCLTFTVWLCYFSILNMATNTMLPGSEAQMKGLIRGMNLPGSERYGGEVPMMPMWVTFVGGTLVTLIPLRYLRTRKGKYLAACRARAATPVQPAP